MILRCSSVKLVRRKCANRLSKPMETGSSAVNSCPSMIFIMRSAIHSINRRLLGSATNRAERVLDSYWKKRDRLRTNPHRSFPLDGPRLESFKTIVQRLPGFASIPPPDQIHWSYKPQTRFYIPFFAFLQPDFLCNRDILLNLTYGIAYTQTSHKSH